MKNIIYIAQAVSDQGDTIQENAYFDAEYALERATLMANDISANTKLQVRPEIVPMYVYNKGDIMDDPDIISQTDV